MGDRGVVGPIVRNFLGGEFVTANTLAGVWKPTDAMPLTPALVTRAAQGQPLRELHDRSVPGRRGARPDHAVGWRPARGSPARHGRSCRRWRPRAQAIVAATLTDEGFVFRMTANDLLGPPTSGGIQNAPAGAVGPSGPADLRRRDDQSADAGRGVEDHRCGSAHPSADGPAAQRESLHEPHDHGGRDRRDPRAVRHLALARGGLGPADVKSRDSTSATRRTRFGSMGPTSPSICRSAPR